MHTPYKGSTTVNLEQGDTALVLRKNGNAELVYPISGDPTAQIADSAYVATCLLVALKDKEVMTLLSNIVDAQAKKLADERKAA